MINEGHKNQFCLDFCVPIRLLFNGDHHHIFKVELFELFEAVVKTSRVVCSSKNSFEHYLGEKKSCRTRVTIYHYK